MCDPLYGRARTIINRTFFNHSVQIEAKHRVLLKHIVQIKKTLFSDHIRIFKITHEATRILTDIGVASDGYAWAMQFYLKQHNQTRKTVLKAIF